MNTAMRKRSPRAPSIALSEAIEKASKIYDIERCHAAPAEGVAQHLGYKNAGNGAVMSVLASLRYYGLLERPKDGVVAVSKDIESYKFAPNETIKQALITKWLKSPPVFAELLDKYTESLPSDATLKFELIQKGFSPTGADICQQVFRRSVDFAHYFEHSPLIQAEQDAENDGEDENTEQNEVAAANPAPQSPSASLKLQHAIVPASLSEDADRIPVRLAGGRRAWIEIPIPFYAADKERLKKQIDLLLTDDEEDSDDLL